jgi:hypothetical protein
MITKNKAPFSINNIRDQGDLCDYLEHKVSEGKSVYGQALTSEVPRDNVRNWLLDKDYWSQGLKIQERGDIYFLSSNSPKLKNDLPTFLTFYENSNFLILLTVDERENFQWFKRFVFYSYGPILSRNYLETSDFSRFLGGIEDDGIPKIRVLEYVARKFISNLESEKTYETDRQWTDKDFFQVISDVNDEEKWLSMIKLVIGGGFNVQCKFWRDSSFLCESNFEDFWNNILEAFVSEQEIRHRELFNLVDEKELNSLKIQYKEKLFEDIEQNKRFLNVLEGLKDSELSVYHGNPYIHANLSDYIDGSNFDVWVTRPDEIYVVPSGNVSVGSFERVLNHINGEFSEGKIEKVG